MTDEKVNQLSACRCLESMSNDPKFPVAFDEEMNEYVLLLVPKGIGIIRFCPWCGKAAPASRRSEFFTVPTAEDVSDVESMMATIKNESDMRRLLGEPDMTFPANPNRPNSRTQYDYSERWSSLVLRIHQKSDGALEMGFTAKHLKSPKYPWPSK